MKATRTHSAHQLSDRTRRSPGTWVVAVTVAVLALGTILVMTSTAAASGDPGCPPPSAQLSATQPTTPAKFYCAAVDEIHLTDLTPKTVSEPVDVDVVQTPTRTTTLPDTAL